MKNAYLKQLFEVIDGTNVSTDFAPEISIDQVNTVTNDVKKLREVLGVQSLIPVNEGGLIKRYKTTVVKPAEQVAEGELIKLTKTTRTPLTPITLTLNKYLKLTTAEAIQTRGERIAINESDAEAVADIRKDIKDNFFANIKATGSTAAAGGADFQQAVAAAWGTLTSFYEDLRMDKGIYFANPITVSKYLGTAAITTQEASGISYLENFMGIGTLILSKEIGVNDVYATASNNLKAYYVPATSETARWFELTTDETGLVGVTHGRVLERASIQTLMMSAVAFVAEDQAGVIKSTITA